MFSISLLSLFELYVNHNGPCRQVSGRAGQGWQAPSRSFAITLEERLQFLFSFFPLLPSLPDGARTGHSANGLGWNGLKSLDCILDIFGSVAMVSTCILDWAGL